MSHSSIWTQSINSTAFPRLDGNISVDVLVVGGGLMGVTTAYLLSKAGQKVALIERDRIASGETANTTAHLTAAMDLRLTDMEKTFGETGARSLWDAGDAAIQQIRDIVTECQINCDLATVPGFLHLAADGNDEDLQQLHADLKVASRLDIQADFVAKIPFFERPGIRFANQARFHPLKYIAGVVKQLEALGCRLYEDTSAEEFTDDGQTIRCGPFRITARKTIIATHTPIVGNTGLIGATLFQTKLALYTSYVVCAEITKHAIPDCLFSDTADPYNYLRLQPAGEETDYAIYGGMDHKTGQEDDTESVFSALEERLNQHLSSRHIKGKMAGRWSGQVIETNDGAPFIGENANHQFSATGFSGNGMTFGTVAGMMATDWVLGRNNPWAALLAPSRKTIVGGTLDYIKENIDFPYYYIKDRLSAAETALPSSLKPGEGKILRIGGERLAVYRDPAGEIVKLSPVCPHLGCLVNWNDSEHTWDCPCHGSRFDPKGEVRGGPAESALERK